MADVEIGYKGSTIASMSSSGTLTLDTAGTYCEDDITINYTRMGISVVETLDSHGGTIVTINGNVVDTGWETAPESWAYKLIDRTISGSVYGSMVLSISKNAFAWCSDLTSISFPNCTYINSKAFWNCTGLTSIYFPECIEIRPYAFSQCTNLISINFSKCLQLGSGAFNGCQNLISINFPKVSSIFQGAFQNCHSLTSAFFPTCLTISSYAFLNCENLEQISFPYCHTIGSSAFCQCSNLTTVSFPNCLVISDFAFNGCSKLLEAYFMGDYIVQIGSDIFSRTPISNSTYLGVYGSIYVPSSLLSIYKERTNWAAYSKRMVGI